MATERAARLFRTSLLARLVSLAGPQARRDALEKAVNLPNIRISYHTARVLAAAEHWWNTPLLLCMLRKVRRRTNPFCEEWQAEQHRWLRLGRNVGSRLPQIVVSSRMRVHRSQAAMDLPGISGARSMFR